MGVDDGRMHEETSSLPQTHLGGRPTFLWLARERFDVSDETFRVRRRWPRELVESVERDGVRTPLLVVRRGERLVLVSGWGRFLHAAREAPLPCFELPSALSDEQLWDELLRDNDRWTAAEVARVLERLAALPGLDTERLAREKLPLLGLRPARDLVAAHLRLLGLPPEALEFIDEEALPLRRTRVFFRLEAGELPEVIELTQRLRLTQSELVRTLELVEEVSHRDGAPAAVVLGRAAGEGRGKREVLGELECLRRPQLASFRRRLAELERGIAFDTPVRIEWDSTLERPGIVLRVELADEEALERFEREVGENSERLRRFFDVL